MGGGLESRSVGGVCGAALKTTTHPKTRRRKPYAATADDGRMHPKHVELRIH